MPCALVFGDEIVASGGQRFGVLIGSSSGVVVLSLNGHLFVKNLGLLSERVAGEHVDYPTIESLHHLTTTLLYSR